MALNIVNLKDPQELIKMGAEYICTGFMFDVPETNKSLQEQMASFDFIGVDEESYGTNPVDMQNDGGGTY
jgi:hypothetical protein